MQARRAFGSGSLLTALRIVHPFPTLANVVATVGFGLIAGGHLHEPGALARLGLSMLAIQCAIGAANDAADVELDRRAKPWKPIVSGAISRRGAVAVATLAALAGSVLAASFGLGTWLLAMTGLACGLAYDLGLKRTRFSVAPYLLAFAVYPLWVWSAAGRFTPALLWTVPLALLVGVSLYLGNTAPDITSDSAGGVRGLAHLLGLRWTLLACRAAFLAALISSLAIALPAGYSLRSVVAGCAGAAALFGVSIAVARRGESGRALERAWGVLICAALLLAAGWLLGAP
jgi:4-hydroxybenzoate polyprenyltransferase